jgi:hypothetical protein
MFIRIRKMLNAPFVRSPEKRGLGRRLFPELLAGSLYGLGLLGWLLLPARSSSLCLVVAIGVAGLIGFVGAIYSGSQAWAREKNSYALSSIVLTGTDLRKLVWGRLLLRLWPWLRFHIYLLPGYLLLAGTILGEEQQYDRFTRVFMISCSDAILGYVLIPGYKSHIQAEYFNALGIFTAAVRWLNSIFLFLLAFLGAYSLGLRCRSSGQALWRAAWRVPLGGLLLVGWHEAFLLVGFLGLFPFAGIYYFQEIYYFLVAVDLLLRLFLLGWLIRKIRELSAHWGTEG